MHLTISQVGQALKKREISSVEITQRFLSRIEEVEGKVFALVTKDVDLALSMARLADDDIGKGNITPLTGIPMMVKDVILTKGTRTTCSSQMLSSFIPPYDATVVEKLREQRAVILGKTNMDEFAMGSSTENSAFFPTHNPWNLECVPGGSSGGSAAAVAAGETVYSLGSDTGGSIRQPASFCGIVGLKPTYGRVSRYGLVAFASSLDQIGPLTSDVADSAIVLSAISGYDPRDSTSVHCGVPDYTQFLTPDLRGMHIGIPQEYFALGIDPEVQRTMQDAIREMEKLGADISETSLPHTKYALSCYYIIAPSEASANLARYDGVKYGFSYREGKDVWENMGKTRGLGFGPEVKRRIMLGTYALSKGYYDAYYLKAQKVRTKICLEFEEAFKKYDCLVAPTSPTVAFRLGEKVDDPMKMYLSDVCTLPVSIAGLPAISLPCGLAHDLPVGMQIIGRPFGEGDILHAAFAYEKATKWHELRPKDVSSDAWVTSS